MPQTLEGVKFLTNNYSENFEFLIKESSMPIFSNETIELLSRWSETILKLPGIRNFPDVATFAFFIRKANLIILKNRFKRFDSIQIGKGIIFHVAPGNVPINFAFSLVAGLLSGNINIVKVSSREFMQVNLLVDALNKLLELSEFTVFKNRIFLLRYNRMNKATDYLSSFCDVRIIWGGDSTISEIRKSFMSARSTEITFADRYSIAVIDSDYFLNFEDKKSVANHFYNDTYLFDQNACTSPHLIIWKGGQDSTKEAQQIFWQEVEQILEIKQFELSSVLAVDKLTNYYLQATRYDDLKLETLSGNDIWRVQNGTIPKDIEYFSCTSGFFNEYRVDNLNEISPIINRKYQTLSYFGITQDDINSFITNCGINGLDRIVPMGKTMDFSLIWDGYNLIESLSRTVEVM